MPKEKTDKDWVCTACAFESKPKGVDPRNTVSWSIGRCDDCRKTKYLTERGNFNAPNDQ